MSDDALEDLIDDGGQDAFVVVGAERSEDLREGFDPGSGEDSAGDIDHLKVLGAGEGGDVAGFGADVVCDGCFEPGDVYVCS